MTKSLLTDSVKNKCIHCGLACASNEQFCCKGCEAAYNLINQMGFNQYYSSRNLKDDVKPLKPEGDIEIELDSFISQSDNGDKVMYLAVEGLHCASCIWLIESVLHRQAAIVTARLNLSTKRLYLRWRGDNKEARCFINLVNSLGYKLLPYSRFKLEDEGENKRRELLRYLAVSAFASGNLMLISICLWSSSVENMGLAMTDLLRWLSALIAMPAIIYCGQTFYKSAFKALKHGRTNMDVPISLAVLLAAAMSLIEIFGHGRHIYFESATMLLFFLLIGRYLDYRARNQAQSAAQELLMLLSGSASILQENGTIKIIPLSSVKADMIILTAAGEKIAADGIIIEGESEIDNSAITGESIPQRFCAKDHVFAGTINLSAALKIKVSKASEDSLIAEIVKLLEQAEQAKSRFVSLSERVSRLYTPIVHLLALITFLLWYFVFASSWQEALLNSITVLIITCPCALGLAIPVVYILASSRLFTKAILLKNGDSLEKLTSIRNIIFDKTGTLTTAKLHLRDRDAHPAELFALAASMASYSKHPLSKALSSNYTGPLLAVTPIEHAGLGLSAIYAGHEARLGSSQFCNIDIAQLNKLKSTNIRIWFSYRDETTCFEFSDELKEDSIAVIKLLQKHYNVYLLSGDVESVVKEIAGKLNINNYYANKRPAEKLAFIKQIKLSGPTLMIGDGLNDAPSLAEADVSMSPSSAIDISQTAADLIFQSHKLYPIIEAIETAQKAYSLARQNITIAFIYNIIAIPAAMAGLINPLIAAIAMSASSLTVTLNSFRLKSDK